MKKPTAQGKRHSDAKAAIGHLVGKRRPNGSNRPASAKGRRRVAHRHGGLMQQMNDFLKGLSSEQFDSLRAEAIRRMTAAKLGGVDAIGL